jgi:hypothetical protein
MSVHDLISAISKGNALDTEQSFKAVMADKISAKLEDMRVSVAAGMFNSASEDSTNEISNEE